MLHTLDEVLILKVSFYLHLSFQFPTKKKATEVLMYQSVAFFIHTLFSLILQLLLFLYIHRFEHKHIYNKFL